MEKVCLEKCMNFVVVAELEVTPLKMVDPIAACILNIERNMHSHFTILHLFGKSTW
jgi:hypothetical protein